jgi:prolyl oligopeptidase
MNCRRESTFVSLKLSSFVLPGRSMWFELTPQTTLPPQVNIFFDEGPEGFDGADVDVEQIFYQSPAGEKKVPMFICKAKGYVPDGATPTILYCYGGFGISITPSFSLQAVAWVKKFGGVYAVANIRGGGEYGEAWHDAGKQRHKENCFTDLAAGAEELIRRNYCSPATLAINGGSNGGLVVSATGLKYPHLFRAVIADVGVLDCFKFHKFTIGHAWRSDFGDPDVEADFRILQTYSPLHNVRCNVGYPAFLIKTGDHDDRVVPLHSLKFLATLQHANPEQTGADGSRTGPFLGRIEVAAGHGAGKPTSKILQETAETLAFAATELGARYVA